MAIGIVMVMTTTTTTTDTSANRREASALAGPPKSECFFSWTSRPAGSDRAETGTHLLLHKLAHHQLFNMLCNLYNLVSEPPEEFPSAPVIGRG